MDDKSLSFNNPKSFDDDGGFSRQPFGLTNLAQLARFRKWAKIHPELNLDPNAPLPEHLSQYLPGCGRSTHVVGTNGGMMPCGGELTSQGKTGQYFCAECTAKGLQSVHD